MSSSSIGYQPLAQSVEEADVTERPAPAGPTTQRKRGNSTSSRTIDLKKLDRAFKRWTESIAQKIKRNKKVSERSRIRIWRSVFEPTHLPLFVNEGTVKTLDHKAPMTQAEFDYLAQSVRTAISDGIHPKMIAKGSSGSYFVRAKTETGRIQVVAVFKPKDEEPYGRLNPKTMKWLHRQFRWIIPFGRSCLIPNLSYISEAAASLLDERLNLHIVPPTRLVSLSSSAFFYDWLDRSAAKKGKPLPEKIGSMQYFLHGYQDASEFLRKHPWPGRSIADTFDDSTHRRGDVSKKLLGALKILCGKTGDPEFVDDDVVYDDDRIPFDVTEEEYARPFYWSPALQQDFREELEKLVILGIVAFLARIIEPYIYFHTDYLMLNTDRGADNYMVKYCEGNYEKPLVNVAPARSIQLQVPLVTELREDEAKTRCVGASTSHTPDVHIFQPQEDYRKRPHIHIAAIDNSLSFPHEHPQGWRSYTYGWLYLPVNLIGRPFSDKTRNHFLPFLTSKHWWEETSYQLEKLFAVDPDFHPKMFKRQLAVIKGQAYNIVQSLKHQDEGPLELTRRQKLLVWDEEVEVAEDAIEIGTNPLVSSPRPSISSVPAPKRVRSHSGSDFPPPIRRTSTDASGLPRPIPFAAKFQRVHPGTTGVTVLEHLERLDAVEASLQRLGSEDPAQLSSTQHSPIAQSELNSGIDPSHYSPLTSPLATVVEVPSSASSVAEEDLNALSMSTPLLGPHSRDGEASRELDWMNDQGAKRNVIIERIELINKRPFFACW